MFEGGGGAAPVRGSLALQLLRGDRVCGRCLCVSARLTPLPTLQRLLRTEMDRIGPLLEEADSDEELWYVFVWVGIQTLACPRRVCGFPADLYTRFPWFCVFPCLSYQKTLRERVNLEKREREATLEAQREAIQVCPRVRGVKPPVHPAPSRFCDSLIPVNSQRNANMVMFGQKNRSIDSVRVPPPLFAFAVEPLYTSL